jgi:GxxExxY protein
MKLEKGKLIYQELSGLVIGGFYTVYNQLGFGFLESVYASALSLLLRRRGLLVEREVPTQVYFLGQPIAIFRLDMVVERKLVLEIKASKTVGDPERKQLFNYLRSTDLSLGLLLHFGPEPKYQRVISTKKLHRSVIIPPNPFNPR